MLSLVHTCIVHPTMPNSAIAIACRHSPRKRRHYSEWDYLAKGLLRNAAESGEKRPPCVEVCHLLDGWAGLSSPITSCIPLSPEVPVACCASPGTASDLAITDTWSCLVTASPPKPVARSPPFLFLLFTGRGGPPSDVAFGVDG